MDVCVYTSPHSGATYEDQLRFVRRAEECGFTGFFRSDHYQAISGDGLPGPTDAWVTLAALARETSRIRLGTLVSPVTFRQPGPLSLVVAQIDQMSSGRVELGLGAGWFEKEHLAYGLAFPPAGERLDQLEEQLQVITGMWRTRVGHSFSFHGRHYDLTGAPALPKPVQSPGPRVIVGGRGTRRVPEIAARYATEFNTTFVTVEEATQQFQRAKLAAERVGRNSAGLPPLLLSNGVVTVCGRSDTEVSARAESLRSQGGVAPVDPVVGPPSMLVDRISALAAAGADRVYLRIVDMGDLDHLDLIAAEVLPAVTKEQ